MCPGNAESLLGEGPRGEVEKKKAIGGKYCKGRGRVGCGKYLLVLRVRFE